MISVYTYRTYLFNGFFFFLRCGWQRYEMKRNVMKWNFALRLKLTVLSLSCRKSEPNSLASSSPVLIRLFTYYFVNSDRILCSRICLDSIYALKKKKNVYFPFWGVTEGGGEGEGVMMQCIRCVSICQKGSWKGVHLLPKPPGNVYEPI